MDLSKNITSSSLYPKDNSANRAPASPLSFHLPSCISSTPSSIYAAVEKKEETKGKQKEDTKDSPIMKQWKELKAKLEAENKPEKALVKEGDMYSFPASSHYKEVDASSL